MHCASMKSKIWTRCIAAAALVACSTGSLKPAQQGFGVPHKVFELCAASCRRKAGAAPLGRALEEDGSSGGAAGALVLGCAWDLLSSSSSPYCHTTHAPSLPNCQWGMVLAKGETNLLA